MKYSHLFAGVALSVMVLAGCNHPGSAATRRVAARLNTGGSYYLLSDQTLIPAQFRFMLERIRPSVAPVVDESGLPFTFDQAVDEVTFFCCKLGLDRVKATGASSIVLYGSEARQPYYFHNRTVLDIEESDTPPPFLSFYDGEKIWLYDYLGTLPANTVGAGVGYLNFGALWRWVNSSYQLPPQVATVLQSYFQCSPEEFFDGISGRFSSLILPPDEDGIAPRMVFTLPDKDNRVYKLIAKLRFVDPDKVAVLSLPLGSKTPIEALELRRGDRQLTVVVGKDVLEQVQEMIANGETLAKNPALKRARVRIPDAAVAFNVYNDQIYKLFNIDGDNGQELWSVGAMTIEPHGMVTYLNDYYDWNGMPFHILTALLPNCANAFQMAQAVGQGVRGNCRDAAASAANLKQLGLALMMYHMDYKDTFPAPAGFAGWKALADKGYLDDPAVFRIPGDDETTRAASVKEMTPANVSYVYFGSVPGVNIVPFKMPLAFERPDWRCDGQLAVLFADGHVQSFKVPEEIDDCEELISYLHTQLKFDEKDLKALSERAASLDKELDL